MIEVIYRDRARLYNCHHSVRNAWSGSRNHDFASITAPRHGFANKIGRHRVANKEYRHLPLPTVIPISRGKSGKPNSVMVVCPCACVCVVSGFPSELLARY